MFSPSCWTGWQSSHRPLIFWSPYSLRLRCQMAVMFEEGVKKKEKKNRNRLGVVTSRREEWVRRRESVKVLWWRLEAGVTSAAFEGSVTKRGNYLAFASLERGDKRAKRHQKVINLASILSRRLWFSIRVGGTHFTSNQPLFAAPLQTGHERLVSGVERSQILKAPLSQTV